MPTRINPLLTLSEFRDQIYLHPLYLAQIGSDVPKRSRGACQNVFFEYPYQSSDQIARQEVLQTIHQAEELFRSQIGFYPAPKFIVNEAQQYPQHYQNNLYGGYGTPQGKYKSIQVNNGFVQNIGIELLTELDPSQAVVLSDPDGDGFNELFTTSVAVADGVSADEIACFFITADRLNQPLTEWEIRPVSVTISGGVATITGDTVLLVKPINVLGLDPQILSADPVNDATNFVSAIAIYRRTVDTAETGSLIWEMPNNWCDTPPCSAQIETACFGVRDKEAGWITPRPATYDADLAAFTTLCTCQYRAPDRVTVNYLAGYPRQSNGLMNDTMARIISLLAITKLPNRTCGCARTDQIIKYYQSLPSDGEQKVYFNDMSPFGRERGALDAWALAEQFKQGRGILAYG